MAGTDKNGKSGRKGPVLDSGGAARRNAPATRGPGRPAPRRKTRKGAKWRNLLIAAWEDGRLAAKKIGMFCGVFLLIFLVWFFLSQPGIDQLASSKATPSVLIKTEDGQIVGSYGEVHGDWLKYEEFPQSLIDSVLATEDRNFFHHFGVDPMGVARAFMANLRAGETVQGGSTITQQVAKNVFLTPERTLIRKLREVLLAFRLESHFSKKDIMSIYLNRVYMGAGNYGVDAASRRYFNKSARQLTLSESAILAGLLKAPSRFAPTSNPELAKKRAEQVLLNMVDAGYLKDGEAKQARDALAATITRTARNTAESSLYFTDWVMDQLPDFVGDVQEDLVVTATLKFNAQRAAEAAIAGVMDKEGEKLGASQAALVAMTPDGAVRAMIGGRDYSTSQFNRAVQAKRQPGSAFKLFVYLAGLEAGYTPGSRVVDQPVSVGKWQPHNYTGDYKGEMSLANAVAQSVNTVAVQISESVGRRNVVAMAQRLGIKSGMNPDPSIALGSNEVNLLELTGAYTTLAANGQKVEPYGITRIATAKGKTLYRREDEGRDSVLSGNVVGMMNSLLSGVITSGTGQKAAIGRSAAGKTGTTSDYRDAWFMGYTPDLAAGVWVGNDDNTPMKKVTGGTLPAPIWRDFMRAALQNVPARNLPVSGGGWFDSAPDAGNPPLPWQQKTPDVLPGARPTAPKVPGGDGQDYQLDQSFWNTLFGAEKAKR